MAELYDRWRPGYPSELYGCVLQDRPNLRVLEAGAGTAKASVALALRGARVVAVEPDPAMAAVARRRVQGLKVEVRQSTFEDCGVEAGAFDLVVSAQAWHWIDPQRGAEVAARALRPDGSLCLWWNRPQNLHGKVWDAIHEAYVQHAPTLDRRDRLAAQPAQERGYPPLPGFTAWTHHTYDWSACYHADSYTGLLRTHSDHLQLPTAQLDQLVAAVGEAVDHVGGGQLEYRYRTVLLTAHPERP